MGRDVTILSSHPACSQNAIRSIVAAQHSLDAADTVRFALKPGKVFLFEKNTGKRIPIPAGRREARP